MLDCLAFLICAGTFIPFVLLLPPGVREEYCPCCCCLPSLHLVQDDDDEDEETHKERRHPRRGGGGGGGAKKKRHGDGESSSDSESDSGDELGQKTNASRRSRSRAGKGKPLKHSGEEQRKQKKDTVGHIRKTGSKSNSLSSEGLPVGEGDLIYTKEGIGIIRRKSERSSKIPRNIGKDTRKAKTDRGNNTKKTPIHSSSYSSEDEETENRRRKKEGASKSRYPDKNHRGGESARGPDELRRSRSRTGKGKSLKHSGEEQRKLKDSVGHIRKTHSKSNSLSSEGLPVVDGDLIYTTEGVGIIRRKSDRSSKIPRNIGDELARRTDELRRSRSRAEKGKTSKHSVPGEEQRKTKKGSGTHIGKSSIPSPSWSSNGGDSLCTDVESGSVRWRDENTSKTPRHTGEGQRKTKEDSGPHNRKSSIQSTSWSSNGGDTLYTNEESGSAPWRNENTDISPRHTGGDSLYTNEESGSARWRIENTEKTPRYTGGEPLYTNEETGSARWRIATKSNTPRHTGGELARRTEEIRRSRSRLAAIDALKLAGEGLRKSKRGTANSIRETSPKNSVGDANLLKVGDPHYLRKTSPDSRSRSIQGDENQSKVGVPHYLRKTSPDSRSRSIQAESDKLNPKEGSDSLRWAYDDPRLTGAGRSTRTSVELGNNRWTPEDTSKRSTKCPGAENLSKVGESIYLRKTPPDSRSRSIQGDENQSKVGDPHYLRKSSPDSRSRSIQGDENQSKVGVPHYLRKTSPDSRSRNIQESDKLNPKEESDSLRWAYEYPRLTGAGRSTRTSVELGNNRWTPEDTSKRSTRYPEDESPREKEDSTLRPNKLDAGVAASPNTEGLGETRRTIEDTTNNRSPTVPGDERKCNSGCLGSKSPHATDLRIPVSAEERTCNPSCLGFRSPNVTEVHTPEEENHPSKSDDKHTPRSQASQLKGSRQDPPCGYKVCQQQRSILICGCSNNHSRCC